MLADSNIYIYRSEGSNSKDRMYPITATNYYGYTFETPLNVSIKEIKISELFDYFGKGKVKSLAKCDDGVYPCISCSAVNNGTAKYISTYDYDTEKLGYPIVSVPGNGDLYQCFIQIGKFSATPMVHLLKLKDKYNYLNKSIGLLAFLMSNRFGDGTYEYHKGILNTERLFEETIILPVITNDNEFTINENLLNNWVYSIMI